MIKGNIVTAYDSHFYEILEIDEISTTLERILHKDGKPVKRKQRLRMPISLLRSAESRAACQIADVKDQVENLYNLIETINDNNEKR